MKEAIEQVMSEDEAYDCKYIGTEEADPFKLITPIIIEGKKMTVKIDTGSEVSCINKYILNKDLSHITINPCEGNLTFLAIDDKNKDTSVQRIGVTEPINTGAKK
jgi:hypothetical protein